MKIRFVNFQILKNHLPAFLNPSKPLTEEGLERLVDSIEQEVILSKALEILSQDPAVAQKIEDARLGKRELKSSQELLKQAINKL